MASASEDSERTGLLYVCVRMQNNVIITENSMESSPKIKETQLLYDPSVPLLCTQPKGMSSGPKESSAWPCSPQCSL